MTRSKIEQLILCRFLNAASLEMNKDYDQFYDQT